MTTRGYCNEQYYGKKLSVEDILSSSTISNDNGLTHQPFGEAKMRRRNRDYETLIQMLNDYCVDENLDNNNYVPPLMVQSQKEEDEEPSLESEEEEELGQKSLKSVGHHLNGQNGQSSNHYQSLHGNIEPVEIGFHDENNEQCGDPEVDIDDEHIENVVIRKEN